VGGRPRVLQGHEIRTTIGPTNLRRRMVEVQNLEEACLGKGRRRSSRYPRSPNNEGIDSRSQPWSLGKEGT
jgi:hypothetical protein